MKILLPNQNYSENMNFSVENEVSDYEIKKAFSPDIAEYGKIVLDALVLWDFSSINTGTQALLLLTDGYGEIPNLETSSTVGFNTPVTMSVATTYGINDLILREYSTSGLKYYRLDIKADATEDIYDIVFGRSYDLPDGRLEDNSTSNTYYKSKVYTTLAGAVKYNGVATHVRRKTDLSFEFLSSTDKDMLVSIFLYSKGVLPVWFLPDPGDNTTWMQVIITTIEIKEPFAGYFSVNLDMEEL